MATRIAHISDLHFPAKEPAQVLELQRSIAQMQPHMVVVTGDLTRGGTKAEFNQARAFIKSLSGPTLVVPGNHDIPVPGVWARVRNPFGRFESYFPDMPAYLETADILVIGLNTAVGWQPGLDWSLGCLVPSRLKAASERLLAHRARRLGIVACHHPLHQHPRDPVRSRTFGGEVAFQELVSAGMGLLLHGHLHRTDCRCFATANGDICELCANTALANRQRGGPAGYNVIDVENGRWKFSAISWNGDSYAISNGQSRDLHSSV